MFPGANGSRRRLANRRWSRYPGSKATKGWRRPGITGVGETDGAAMGSIVLADDDEDLRAVYGPFLRSLGHEVWEAVGGLEALELVRQHRPRLLILDVWMPRCNGFEVLERLRHDPLSSRMKVLMLSNLGDADTRLECFEMGAADYLVKGLALGDFRDRIAHLLAVEPCADPTSPVDCPDPSTT